MPRTTLALLALTLAACGGSADRNASSGAGGGTCAAQLEAVLRCVQAAATPLPPARQLPAGAVAPIALYVDRSGSMTGYLDESFGAEFGVGPGRSSMRQLLAQLAGIEGAAITLFGFGDRVVPVTATSNQDVMRKLVERGFYTDRDTKLEDVLDLIARDSARRQAHVILTDGRRGGGASALAQYKRLGELARAWSSDSPAGGARPALFAIAALDAPFRQKPGDRTGCWAQQATAVRQCPLYAFVFAPRAGAEPLLAALRSLPASLHVAPAFTDSAVTLNVEKPARSAGELRSYAPEGRTALRLLYHTTRPQGVDSTAVTVSADVSGSVARYSMDDSLVAVMLAAPLAARAPSWTPVQNASAAWAKPQGMTRDDAARRVGLRLALRARSALPPTAYRVELVSTGRPAWLERFDAPQQGDSARTYGLASLFEYLQPRQTRLAGFYVGVF